MFFKLSELVVGEGMVVAVGNQNIKAKYSTIHCLMHEAAHENATNDNLLSR
jgi:hypothetical protein